jgi:hypothetical protein
MYNIELTEEQLVFIKDLCKNKVKNIDDLFFISPENRDTRMKCLILEANLTYQQANLIYQQDK